VLALAVGAGACAGIGEALFGTCAATALQVGAQVCVNVACASVCDDDDAPVAADDDDDDVDDAPAEIPPAPHSGDPHALDPPVCRLEPEPGGTVRLSCHDGTSVVGLARGDEAGEYRAVVGRTVDGDAFVDDLADVAALADVFAVTGSLVITGPAFVRVRLPSLRTVGGDVVVRDNPRLLRAELPALVDVGGSVAIERNAALSGSLLPLIKRAQRVSVVDNDALPAAEVDRLLALPPP
jgi:hypothetical protein